MPRAGVPTPRLSFNAPPTGAASWRRDAHPRRRPCPFLDPDRRRSTRDPSGQNREGGNPQAVRELFPRGAEGRAVLPLPSSILARIILIPRGSVRQRLLLDLDCRIERIRGPETRAREARKVHRTRNRALALDNIARVYGRATERRRERSIQI